MNVKFSNEKIGKVAIAGHVGCGHCHSLNNQVQDDSPGLSVVLSLFKKATGTDLTIADFKFEGNKITAILKNGGEGYGTVKRKYTLQEKTIIRRMIGKEAVNTHTVVLEEFGRIYGQGVMETPVAVQTAIANAALNSFTKNYPENFVSTVEDLDKNIGSIVGTVLNINGIPVSVLGTVNATEGGIGPNEDLEGNSPNHSKKAIVEKLGMDKLPTLIVEAMIYSGFSKGLTKPTYFVRGDAEDDNPYAVEAVVEAAKELGIECTFYEGAAKRVKGALKANTEKVASKIIELGNALKVSEYSKDKVQIISDLADVVSQDCGGISFMSNTLHEEIGGAGMIKRTGAVINLVVTEEYEKENPIPFLTDKDLEDYLNLVVRGVEKLNENAGVATNHILLSSDSHREINENKIG